MERESIVNPRESWVCLPGPGAVWTEVSSRRAACTSLLLSVVPACFVATGWLQARNRAWPGGAAPLTLCDRVVL